MCETNKVYIYILCWFHTYVKTVCIFMHVQLYCIILFRLCFKCRAIYWYLIFINVDGNSVSYGYLYTLYTLDGVGPVDNRPSSDLLNQIVKKENIYIFFCFVLFCFTCVSCHVICDTWHVTCDTGHLTYDTWHMTCDT